MTISRKIIITTLATMGLMASTAVSLAVEAQATVSLNVRSGPATTFNVLDVLFSGETVDVTECVTQNSKNWCRIEHSGPDGWVSASYLQAATPPAPPAPTPTPTPTPPPPSGGSTDPNCSFGLVLGPSGPTFSITCGDTPPPAPPPPPPPPAPVDDEVCFYTGANFAGASFCAGPGIYNSLPDMATFNDEISSVQMFGNAKVKMWKHINLNGLSRTYNNSRATLHGNINNEASSFEVFTGSPTPPATPAINLNGTYTIQQKSNGRFLDAHTNAANGWSAVTRNWQNNDTQRWVFTHLGGDTYTIQHKTNMRYLDAWEDAGHGYSAVAWSPQANDSQRWIVKRLGGNTYSIQQKVNGRYLDAWEDAGHDYSAVAWTLQANDTQRWIIQ